MFDNATKELILVNFITIIPIYVFIIISFHNTYRIKGWHLNYRSIFFTILIAISIQSFFTTLNDIFLLISAHFTITTKTDILQMMYNVINFASLYSPGILRLSIWVFVIERLFATQRRKTYEKKRSYILAITIFLMPFIYALIVQIFQYIWTNFDFYYFTICIIIDFVILCLSLSLFYLNIKLKKLTLQKSLDLSEKFQINENIRLIKLMLPLIILFITINIIFNVLLDYGNLSTISRDDLLAINCTTLFITYNIFLIYLLTKFKKIKDTKVECISANNKKEFTETVNNSQCNLKANTVAGNITLFNVDGKKIPTNYDQKTYFEMFAKSWNK